MPCTVVDAQHLRAEPELEERFRPRQAPTCREPTDQDQSPGAHGTITPEVPHPIRYQAATIRRNSGLRAGTGRRASDICWHRRVGVAAQLSLVGVLAACGMVGCGATPRVPPDVPSLAACATSPTALLSQASLPQFRQVVLNTFSQLPVHQAQASSSSLSQAKKQFQRGATVGYVIGLAYSAPYSSSGTDYTSGGGPVLPLQGPIVIQHATLLEAYELVTVFSARAGTVWYQEFVERSIGSVPGVAHPALPRPYQSYYTAKYALGNSPSFEHEVRVDAVLRGRIEVDFAFRGGDKLTVLSVLPLVHQAITAVVHRCFS